ncbi:copper chaperone PCu(A)C [Catenulispora subtropica]|uniref:Copper chaperone PCu(A)C n=1 Tax=Catenulispora subtropica TaxID=450798 RepID=A0ABP5C5Z6_9ACTN
MRPALKAGAVAAPLAVLAAGAGLLLWSGGDAAAGTAKLAVRDAYVREPANPSEAAAYFTIGNTGRAEDTLTEVTASTGRASMHTTNGPKMVALSAAPIPARGSLDFSPGADHVMIDDPGPLRPGTTVRLTFRFATSAPITVDAPVIGIGAPAPGAHDDEGGS